MGEEIAGTAAEGERGEVAKEREREGGGGGRGGESLG